MRLVTRPKRYIVGGRLLSFIDTIRLISRSMVHIRLEGPMFRVVNVFFYFPIFHLKWNKGRQYKNFKSTNTLCICYFMSIQGWIRNILCILLSLNKPLYKILLSPFYSLFSNFQNSLSPTNYLTSFTGTFVPIFVGIIPRSRSFLNILNLPINFD